MPNIQQKDLSSHPDALLNTEQSAAYTGLSKRFFELRRIAGGGPAFIRISAKAIRYRKCDLDAWIEERLRTSTSDQQSTAI